MRTVLHSIFTQRAGRGTLWAGLLVLLLAACSSVTPPTATLPETPDTFAYVATIDIDAGASQADIEARYGGTSVVFRPEAGFAILGFTQRPGDLGSMSVDSNQDALAAPEVTAGGVSAWAGGVSAWAGGFSAWAGGVSAWAGGVSAWAGGGQEPSTFVENLAVWDQVNLPEAQVLAPSLGAGVKVAVIDTGVDLDHPGFMGRLAPASEWYDFIDGDTIPEDEAGGDGYGHGTAVAGIILQVAPNVTILPLRVLDADGAGDTDDVIAAIDHAIAHGAQIINLSLGATVDVASLHTMIEYAFAQEVFVIASAGNSDSEAITFPARRAASGPVSEYTVGVSSVGLDDVKSEFANFGDDLELMAPGEAIYSFAPDGQLGHWSGTSFATPIVTGALALAVGETDDPKQFANEMARTADDIGGENKDDPRDIDKKIGEGRLDIYAYLHKIL